MTAGRPLKFKSLKELNEKIDDYFNTTSIEQWTITGLALALDTDRKTLLEYEKEEKSSLSEEENKQFSNAIKKAKLMVENSYEIDLKKSGRPGTIFALKNFEWKDKTEVDNTHKGSVSLTKLFDESGD